MVRKLRGHLHSSHCVPVHRYPGNLHYQTPWWERTSLENTDSAGVNLKIQWYDSSYTFVTGLICCDIICDRWTLMLLLANLANTKLSEKPEKWLKPWHMGIHLGVLSESYAINTNLTRFRWFSNKSLHGCAMEESSLSISRVKALFWLGCVLFILTLRPKPFAACLQKNWLRCLTH